MQDVLIQADSSGSYDLQIDGTDFASAKGFETAIPVSLFTDARVEFQFVQNASRRRGWVGNILNTDIERQLGSILWVLDQTRLNQDTLNRVKVAAQEAFQWMIDDGIILRVSVDVIKKGIDNIEINISFTDLDNNIKRYIVLWRMTNVSKLPNIY